MYVGSGCCEWTGCRGGIKDNFVWRLTRMFLQFIRLLKQSSNDSNVVMTSLKLYKYLLRQCEKLPPDACKHYKFAVKQSFIQHKFEPDPQRVKEIVSKSIEDSKWIVNKYTRQ